MFKETNANHKLLENKLSELESEITRLRQANQENETLVHENKSLREQIEKILTGLEKLSDEKDALNTALQASDLRVKELQVEIENYRQEVQQLTDSVAMNLTLTLERDSLKDQLSELTESYSNLNAELAQVRTLACERPQFTDENICLEEKLHEHGLMALEKILLLQAYEDQVRNENEYQFERYKQMDACKYVETIEYLEKEIEQKTMENRTNVKHLEEELEKLQHEINDSTTLALSAQRQLDESHKENHKLKELNTKVMERLKATRDQSNNSENENIIKEANELRKYVDSLTKKVDELEEANKGFVLNLERNESCMRIENAPGACEIQMVETHVSQQISEELILVTHFFYYNLII